MIEQIASGEREHCRKRRWRELSGGGTQSAVANKAEQRGRRQTTGALGAKLRSLDIMGQMCGEPLKCIKRMTKSSIERV